MLRHTFTSPTSAVVFKAWEYSTYYYDTDAWLPKQMVFANAQAFDRLAPDVRKAILDASKVAEKRGWDMSRHNVDESRKTLVQNGMKVVKPSPTLQAELDKIGETLRADWLKKADDDSKATITAFLAAVGRK